MTERKLMFVPDGTYTWSLVEPEMVRVTAPDGRQKSTQIGGSPPEWLARVMARELEEEKPKNRN